VSQQFRVEAWGFVCGSVCACVHACVRHYAATSRSPSWGLHYCEWMCVCMMCVITHRAHTYLTNNDIGREREIGACPRWRARACALKHMRMRHGANYKPILTARNRV
jgi:hypothetical protein